MSGGGGDSSSPAPSDTTANNTETVINQVPQYEQSYMQDLLGQASTEAAQPYQQFSGQEVASFTPDQTQAFTNIENMLSNGQTTDAGTAALGSSQAGLTTAGTISDAGTPYLQQSASYNPATAAAPYEAAAAADTTPQGISSYLSPYTQNVVGGLVNTANQNWNQNIMPGVNDAFIGSGQFASGRNAQVLGQAANEEQTNLDTSVANALQSGYTTAGQQAATAASNMSSLGSLAGTTAASEAANLQNVGTGLGNLAATQAGAQGAAATNLANTANTVQNTGITGNAALQSVGQQQQNLSQTSINQAMTDFQNQVNFPEQQAGFLSNIIHGLPTAGGSTTSTGQTPATTNMAGSVSPLSALAGTITGAGATLGASGNKKGGLIKGYAEGGQVTDGLQIPDNIDMASLIKGLASINSPDDSPSTSNEAPFSISDHVDAGIPISGNAPEDNNVSPPPPATDFNSPSIPAETSPQIADAAISTAANAIPNSDGGDHDDSPLSSLNLPYTPIPSNDPGANASVSGYNSDAVQDGSITSSLNSNASPMDSAKMRNYQLLAMAKGFLTPARSGAESLGNAIGNYGSSGMEYQKAMAEQQQKNSLRQIEQQRLAQEKSYQTGELGARNQELAQQGTYQQGELSARNAELANQAKYQAAQTANMQQERLKPISDGMGGWMQLDPTSGKYVPLSGELSGNGQSRSISNLYNPPKGADGQPLTGKDFLATLPPAVEAQSQSYISGQSQPPTGFATKPVLLAAYQAAQKADPDFAATAGTRFQTIKEFADTNGKTGQTVKSQNVTMEHVQTLKDAVDALNNGDMKAWNSAVNAVADQTGKPAPNNFNLGRELVADEITKAVLGSSGAAVDREGIKAALSPNASHDQAYGALNEAGKYMAGQAHGLEQSYYAGTRLPDYRDRFLTPEAKKLVDNYYPQRIGTQQSGAAASGGDTRQQTGNQSSGLPKSLSGVQGLSYSASRQQYRDASGNVYDASGNKVQ